MSAPAEGASTRATFPVSTSHDRDAQIYARHAPAVYQQALLMLGDEDLAGQVACDVITGECTGPAASPDDPDDASRRLAVSVLWRCQEQMAGQARQDRAPLRWPARGDAGKPRGDAGKRGLGVRERAVLGLVAFGGLGYREAARALAISPARAAALLRTALITLASAPAYPWEAAARLATRSRRV
jgi:DNA-binding CsgD family transcriptional regulator